MSQGNLQRVKREVKFIALGAAVLFGLIISAYIGWFYGRHDAGPSVDPAAWGQFGDFVGGLGNPIVSLVTLVIVSMAFIAQREEIIHTTAALRDSAVQQERLAGISGLQARIHAQTALLSLKSQAVGVANAEVQRLASAPWAENRKAFVALSLEGKRLGESEITVKLEAANIEVVEALMEQDVEADTLRELTAALTVLLPASKAS